MQCNKIYAWENLDAILYERTFQRNLRLDRVFTITNTKKGMKNTETYMHNKKIIFSLKIKPSIKPSLSDKLVVKVGLHFDGKAKL